MQIYIQIYKITLLIQDEKTQSKNKSCIKNTKAMINMSNKTIPNILHF